MININNLLLYTMNYGLIIILITLFLIANIYYDGEFIKKIKTWKKYYQIIGIIFAGFSIYVFLKKFPNDTNNVLKYTNNMIKYMPIDKETTSFLNPLFKMSNGFSENMQNINNTNNGQNMQNMQAMQMTQNMSGIQKKVLSSGNTSNKRSVSETKKKYVAAEQGWKCGDCQKQLPAWYEVDHKVRLEYGGTNHINNLVALCRDCHGKKTAFENL